ncbi:MAG: amidohydrolase [Oscillospiraceae bacterium]|nr:amidohydrolase [Oscillospiraceae bacterium]
MIDRIKKYLDEKRTYFAEISEKIWATPELAYGEYKSYIVLVEALREQGFEVETGICGIPTAFRAVWGKGKPVVGYLAEYDALPGLSQEKCNPVHTPIVDGGPGHGCGHNCLGTCCAAAACAAKQMMEEDGLEGTLIVYGCPAEEQGCGKAFMTRDGVFDELDIAFAPHPSPFNVVLGDSMTANIQAIFRFKGIPAHAAAMPENGRSALDGADLMIMGTQFLREHVNSEARIHYAYLDVGGTAPNVVQASAALLYYMRAPKVDQVQDIFARMINIAKGAALMTGTEMEYTIESGMREVIPNDVLGNLVAECWAEAGPIPYSEEAWEIARKMAPAVGMDPADPNILDTGVPVYRPTGKCMAGSSDVGDVSVKIPTVMVMTGGELRATPGHSWQLVAQSGTRLMQDAMLHGSAILADATMKVIADPSIAEKAKEELMGRTGCKYECLIPDEIAPPIDKGM